MDDNQIVLVRYMGSKSSKPYAYLVPPWITKPIEKLDKVVVEVRDTISLAEVTSLKPSEHAASFASAFIISVIDLDQHRLNKEVLMEELDNAS